MSVSSIIGTPAARLFFNERVRRPPPSRAPENIALPIADYQPRIGMAFDYALRFGLVARGLAAQQRELVARHALRLLPARSRLARVAAQRFDAALTVLSHLPPAPTISREAAAACLNLAGLEVVCRSGFTDQVERVASVEELEDVQWLYLIVPWEHFTPASALVLNPTFGAGSTLVGGADADIFLDGCIIDVKTTATPHLQVEHLRQLVSYAVLANAYGIEGAPGATVHSVAVYYSRARSFRRFNLGDVAEAESQRSILEYLVGSDLDEAAPGTPA